MAGYRFIDLVSDVETITNLTDQRAMIRRLVNQAQAAIFSGWDWPFSWTWDFLTTVAEITAGDADTTKGSTTVTSNHASTSWPAGVVGRKFRAGTDRAYYTIATRVSATEITLTQPYQGSTGTDKTYSIYQDEFLLRADVDYYKIMRQIENGVALFSKNVTDFDLAYPTPETMGNATIETLIGREDETYTTGTVSASTRTLTGTNTAWTTARGVSRGTKIRISDAIYTVRSVDSATAITTYESMGTIAGGTSYTAFINNLIVQLLDIPNTAENYYYRFQRIPAVMDQDGDIPELIPQLHHLIIEWVMAWNWAHRGFPDRAIQARQFFKASLQDAINRYGHSNPERAYPRANNDLRYAFLRPRVNIINN